MLSSIIPPNIDDGGMIWGGLINGRKLCEGIAVAVILTLLVWFCLAFLPITVRLALIILLSFGALIICLIGYDGMPISIALINYVQFRLNRKKVLYQKPRPAVNDRPAASKLNPIKKKGGAIIDE